ncbi:hypothetical protein ACHHYP_03303 [Achlya hypogyna]|uniref:VanZ-like domain-containing protein n=1 Tax=Achlya hypogyna TaxID=1202772 RepID=A0A1V9Z422_ACHHY|nr:hypothetical protein ACHHYP_03303 [Achlya hypogyna]
MRTIRTVWRVVGVGGVGLLLYLSLTPRVVALPPTGGVGGDKIGHAAAYAVLMFWWAQLDSCKPRLATALILLGVVLEFLQGATGYRSFDFGDMAANATGVILGWAMSCAMPNVVQLVDAQLASPRRRE